MPMLEITSQIEPSWLVPLKSAFEKPSFLELRSFLKVERDQFEVYPPEQLMFEAFNRTPFDKVKVVIIGQDPYHGEGQAHGLSFSVQKGVKLPPSLKNIYKEMEEDLAISPAQEGDLSCWADQGVLLLNATLSVRASSPGSHQKRGWEAFTDAAIEALSSQRENLVFILWGRYAQDKGQKIDRSKHFVIQSAHPSPFSARNGFFGSKPFSKTNAYLIQKGIQPIDWQVG